MSCSTVDFVRLPQEEVMAGGPSCESSEPEALVASSNHVDSSEGEAGSKQALLPGLKTNGQHASHVTADAVELKTDEVLVVHKYIASTGNSMNSMNFSRALVFAFATFGGVFFLVALAVILLYDPIWRNGLFSFTNLMSACNHNATIQSSSKTIVSIPTVILISLDGFRWGYEHKVPTPNINRLRLNGTEAAEGLIPVFPSITFPNHYSIATGLYPGSHGIVANSFVDPNNSSRKFNMGSLEPDWWLGEPIWETTVKQGGRAATFFWPGAEVEREHWKCPSGFCFHYNGSVSYEQRVDTVLGWVDLPDDKRPNLITLYFEEPDHTGHQTGPDSPEIGEAITRVDTIIGRLLDGLDARGMFESIHIILLGDHGMLGNCQTREVIMEDFKPWLPNISTSWFGSYFPLMAIHPPPETDAKTIFDGLRAGIMSKKVKKSQYLSVYLKEDFPSRFNYTGSDRIAPVLGILAEGYGAKFKKSQSCSCDCYGSHGYDNLLLSMRTIFIAHGPQFSRGRKVDSFINVEVYGVITRLLGLKAAPNNGSLSFPDHLLLPQS